MKAPLREGAGQGTQAGRAFRHTGRSVRRFLVPGAVLLVLLVWAGFPAVRAWTLLATQPAHVPPTPPHDLQMQAVTFRAADGTPLAGWFVPAAPARPSVILVAGFKAGRLTMLPYARLLHTAGYNVLLYEGRGLGQSGGRFTAGLREVDDVRGAVAYVLGRHDLRNHHCGLLGVSLGAGVALVAAARLPGMQATIADSAYVDQRSLLARLDVLALRPLRVPLAPVGPWVVDHMLGGRLEGFSPLQAIGSIAPRAVLLIHSRDDANPTTPLAGALALYHAAQPPVQIWIAPRGGHAGALAAQPAQYRRHVLAFLRRYLR